MTRLRTILSATALAALAAGAALAGQTAPQLSAPQRPAPPARPALAAVPAALPATQALFDRYVADNRMPGITAAFGFGELPPVFVSAGAIADDAGAARAGPDSLWRVYSMTKPITAMAAMILIDDGRIKLDQPVSDFIPAFKDMKVLDGPDSLASHPAVHPITIRNLLTHTAGLGYNIVTKGALLKEYERQGILPGTVNAAVEAQARTVRPKTLAEFADRVAALPLIAEPGTVWSYSIGLDVMGRVIEVASGMSFDGFVQRRIFDPLGMRSSYWTVPASEVGRLSTNYLIVGDRRTPLDPAATSVWLTPPSFPYGGAGLVMSARDYDRFLHALQDYGTLDGVQVLKPATARLMMSDLLPAGVSFGGVGAAAGTGGTPAGPRQGFGAGGSVYLDDVPGGPGKGTYGWGGAAGTIAYVDAAHHTRGTVMVNYFPGEKWPLRQEVIPALMADVARYRRP